MRLSLAKPDSVRDTFCKARQGLIRMGWKRFLLAGVLVLSVAAPAQAAGRQPDLLSFGAGWQEVLINTPYRNGGDFRLEHRWGVSLLSALSDGFTSTDEWFQLHPYLGVETSTRKQFYGHGGLVLDFLIGRNIVVSPNFAVGYYNQNQGKRLGHPLEFRSTFEAGFRFDNEVRVTAYLSHISTANIGERNPGVEMAGLYLHLPASK
ncbi:MAG: acyloxyacyl hydrolase [Alphaproteobacteria bacterium]|nr:acyloxyacyl hydrolase [Alphaproteobacteria bacterium]